LSHFATRTGDPALESKLKVNRLDQSMNTALESTSSGLSFTSDL